MTPSDDCVIFLIVDVQQSKTEFSAIEQRALIDLPGPVLLGLEIEDLQFALVQTKHSNRRHPLPSHVPDEWARLHAFRCMTGGSGFDASK